MTVHIHSIAAGGEGVGRLADGRVVFVHRTAPGERAEVVLEEQRARWARGRALRILEPSLERREAPCPHYGRCGGCTLEHLQYAAQLSAKQRIVADALARIGGVDVEVPTVVPSPAEFRYRNRVSFALRRLGGGRVVAGFHVLGQPHRILDLGGECLLPEAPIARAWDALRAGWGADARYLPSGEQLRLTLRGNQAGAVALLVEGGFSTGQPETLLEGVPALTGIWHRPGHPPPELIAGTPGLPDEWGGEPIELNGAAFLQVNRGAAALLEGYVAAAAGAVTGQRVVDAYCGIGLYARRFAAAGADVVGIEWDGAAVAEARRAAPANARFEHGAVEALLPAHLPADLVVLNPPRAGLAEAATAALAAAPPPRVIYISCDPATLARDLRRLAPAFLVHAVRCFDLFPQTAHVETVVELHSAAKGRRLPADPDPLILGL